MWSKFAPLIAAAFYFTISACAETTEFVIPKPFANDKAIDTLERLLSSNPDYEGFFFSEAERKTLKDIEEIRYKLIRDPEGCGFPCGIEGEDIKKFALVKRELIFGLNRIINERSQKIARAKTSRRECGRDRHLRAASPVMDDQRVQVRYSYREKKWECLDLGFDELRTVIEKIEIDIDLYLWVAIDPPSVSSDRYYPGKILERYESIVRKAEAEALGFISHDYFGVLGLISRSMSRSLSDSALAYSNEVDSALRDSERKLKTLMHDLDGFLRLIHNLDRSRSPFFAFEPFIDADATSFSGQGRDIDLTVVNNYLVRKSVNRPNDVYNDLKNTYLPNIEKFYKSLANPREVHVVKLGDSFWKISEQYYGNGQLYFAIMASNGQLASQGLHPGDVIIVPKLSEIYIRAMDMVRRNDNFWNYCKRTTGCDFEQQVKKTPPAGSQSWDLIYPGQLIDF